MSVTPLREQDNLIDPLINARVRTHVRLDVEPKLAGLFVYWTPADLRASIGEIDLTPTGAEGRRELSIPASQRVGFPVDFTLPIQSWNEQSAATGLRLDGTVQVMVATGSVVVQEVGGDRIETEELHFDPNRDRVWSEVATTIHRQGSVLRGSGFTSNTQLTDTRLDTPRGNVEGLQF